MQPQFRYLALAALAVVPAIAQTTSDCDPTSKNDTLVKFCDDPALGTTYSHDFSTGPSDKFGDIDAWSGKNIAYDSQGLHLPCIKTKDYPTILSKFYIFYGRVDVEMKAAPGAGIISSVVFQSDCRDEIDLEFVGSESTIVQTNIFRQGDSDHNDAGNTTVNDTTGTFHTYTIDWQEDTLTYSIDGVQTRQLTKAKDSAIWPQTPMQIKIGSWTAGDVDAPGTSAWAGGKVDWSKGPFDMIVKSIKVQDYAEGASKYQYKKDNGIRSSGNSDAINVVKGSDSDKGNDDSSSTVSSTSTSSTVVSSTSTSVGTSTSTGTVTKGSTTQTKTGSSTSTSIGSSTGTSATTLSTTSTATDSSTQTTSDGTSPTSSVSPKPTSGASSILTFGASSIMVLIAAGLLL